MLWFNFNLGLNFILFQTHYHVIIMHYPTPIPYSIVPAAATETKKKTEQKN